MIEILLKPDLDFRYYVWLELEVIHQFSFNRDSSESMELVTDQLRTYIVAPQAISIEITPFVPVDKQLHAWRNLFKATFVPLFSLLVHGSPFICFIVYCNK